MINVAKVGGVLAVCCLGACAEPRRCSYGAFDFRDGSVVEDPEQLYAYAGDCVVVLGNLTIAGDRISDLTGLEGVVAVHGTLRLQSQALTSTEALGSLEYVEDNLVVADAPSLEQIEIPALRSIGSDLRLGRLPRLRAFAGMPELVEVGRSVSLRELDAMSHLELAGIRAIAGDLYIENNGQLETVVELGALAEIGGYLRIRGNPRLTGVTGFNELDRVGGTIRIGNNSTDGYRQRYPELNDLRPPRAGTVRSIRIDHNERLREIVGFGALERFWTGASASSSAKADITISDNEALESLEAFEGLRGTANSTPEVPVSTRLSVDVVGNLRLNRLPRFAPLDDAGGELRVYLTIENNGALQTLEDLSGWFFRGVDIRSNGALRSTDGLVLADATWLNIVGNDSLTSLGELRIEAGPSLSISIVDNRELSDVTRLADTETRTHIVSILSNAKLPQAQAVWVAGMLRGSWFKVAGNLGWLAADPCPWTEDSVCDELDTSTTRICAGGTDVVDCAQ